MVDLGHGKEIWQSKTTGWAGWRSLKNLSHCILHLLQDGTSNYLQASVNSKALPLPDRTTVGTD